MTERTNEESFNELDADVLPDCPSDCESNRGDLENDTHMKGVDRADQFLANSSILRKTLKWLKKLAFFLINCTLLDAYKTYCTHLPKNKTRYTKFLLEVAREWITVDSKERSIAPDASRISKTASYNDAPFRLSGRLRNHVLEKIVTGRKTDPTRAYRVCPSKGKRSETGYICKSCCVPLHVGDCYTVYHRKKKY
ncbi:uncharacterized protein LOC143302920 [Bombus vancouverensis nearcticus]|uniref:uncharacterized protein LOC143302920 n=1 Tax=Bombus vancouverensis nearcticus TaxID=2705178 RepID=UPI00402B49ED